jgi:FtsH-binding integral membrane protein
MAMAKKENAEMQEEPKGQKIFDNVWLLFALSLLISGLIYNVWGIMDLLGVPPAP